MVDLAALLTLPLLKCCALDRTAGFWNAATQRGPYSTVGKGPIAIMIRRNSKVVYINATSTRECTFRASFAAECG
jgi:hypothetical protein